MFMTIAKWFFFFQAEDGIRDLTVTGVQTCALPIWSPTPDRDPRRAGRAARPGQRLRPSGHHADTGVQGAAGRLHLPLPRLDLQARRDRKSTRLNSSHSQISYAVFCLKKKKIPDWKI